MIENQRDSASNSEDPEDPDADVEWVKKHDKKMDKPFWINPITEIITYDEPLKAFAKETSLVGYRVRGVLDSPKMWYEGVITDFHKGRDAIALNTTTAIMSGLISRWKVSVYKSRRTAVGLWLLCTEHQDSWRRWTNYGHSKWPQFKKEAMEDACQWKIIQNDQQQESVIYISTRTGEIRAGTIDSEDWVVHEDKFGYPCFYNLISEGNCLEDPRFIHDTDEDLNQQANTYTLKLD